MPSLLLPETRARFAATLADPKAEGLDCLAAEAGALGVMLGAALEAHDAFDALLARQIATMARAHAALDEDSDEAQHLAGAIYDAQLALKGTYYAPPAPAASAKSPLADAA